MPSQIVYQTNADLIATYESLVETKVAVADLTEKGLLWFKLKESKPIFLLSAKGKLVVKWENNLEKRALCKRLKSILIPLNNRTVVLTAKKEQIWKRHEPSNFES